MPKTKEQIKKYNKEYFQRPEVIARAKIRNSQRKNKRKEYKKTEKGRIAENRYRNKAYQNNKHKRLFLRYGITQEQYDSMLILQGGVCAICKQKPKSSFHLDHCHSTGKVRGILCSNCNMALGLLKDNTTFLQKAIEYLSK